MEIIKKSLKVYILSLILFIILSLMLAAVICFTGFKEAWGYVGIITIFGLSAVVAGILESKVIGRRILFVFLISAALFGAIVYLLISLIFSGQIIV